MKTLVQAVIVAGFVGAIGGTASAQDGAMDSATMTCADFMAMDEAGRMSAMDAMASTDAMAPAEGATDGMAADAMATDDMAADATAAGDAMATDGMASDDMASDGAMATDNMTAMVVACEGQPDMMAMDAMSAMSN